jgi:flagellin-like protein
MMKKTWKNNKAVSPVIATILMVAITVVLAAVLYVMVMGFGSGGTTSAPTASLTTSGSKLILSISKPYALADGSITFMIGASTTKITTATGVLGSPATTISFTDAGVDGKVSTGDYFQNSAATPLAVKIVWTSGGTSQVIAEGTI